MSPQRSTQPFVVDTLAVDGREIPRVSSLLTGRDRWGTMKVRCGIGRMHYTVDPGLYALGNPDSNSPIVVTANYKLSFDALRSSVPGRDAWILVLDTKGINVWCAAGKGTFGTTELVRRIELSGLHDLVSHRELILPQLAGPGIAAHVVRELTGFKVIYGPIRAQDLSTFFDAGKKATPEMRRKTFTMRERAVLIPLEFIHALKWGLIGAIVLLTVGGLGPTPFWHHALTHAGVTLPAIFLAIIAGTVITPLLLPWLPGRPFAVKGVSAGLITVVLFLVFHWGTTGSFDNPLELAGWFFLMLTTATYLAMDFTGASTFTSLSGVRKEMRWSVPLEIAGAAAGLILWSISHFVTPGA